MAKRTVKRAYKYRFYPTQQQEVLLLRTFGCVRLVWNRMLEHRTTVWHQKRRSVSYVESSKILTQWKSEPELAFLNEVSSVPLQQSLRHLQDGFQRFWSKQNAYPRFKSRKKSRKSAEFTSSAFRWKDGALWLAKCDAPLDIVWSRALPEGAQPSSVTVSQDRAGRWFVSMLVEEQITQLAPLDATTSAVGVDMGLNHLAILSTGEKISNPRHTARDARALARAQRAHAHKQKGSNNREKARLKVARIQARTADRRHDFLHKLTTSMIRENQTIVIEDLAVQNMSRRSKSGGSHKKGLNRAIRDASWSELRSQLEYKAAWYGRDVVVLSQWFPSSQLCSACGQRTGPRGDLAMRSWKCSACGAAHDRDVNAAKNILAAGLAASVCGDGRSLRHAHS